MDEQELQEVTELVQEAKQAETAPPTEEQPPKTVVYTQEQFSKMQSTFERKQREAERRAAEAERRLQEYADRMEALQQQIELAEEERTAKILAGLDSVPEGERIKQLYVELKNDRARYQEQMRKLQEYEEQAMQGLKFYDAWQLAKDAEGLVTVDELLECDSYEDMLLKVKQAAIEKIKAAQGKPESKPQPKAEAKPRVPGHVDSGVQTAVGTGRFFKASDIQKMSPEERVKLGISKAIKEGRIKWDE